MSLGIILTDIDYPSAQLDEPVDFFRHRTVGYQLKMESILTPLGLGHFHEVQRESLAGGVAYQVLVGVAFSSIA